jgi:protein required for attachment to host cells
MAKQMSCNQVVARAIRKFGLPAVRAAVEMAVELSIPDQLGQFSKKYDHKVKKMVNEIRADAVGVDA